MVTFSLMAVEKRQLQAWRIRDAQQKVHYGIQNLDELWEACHSLACYRNCFNQWNAHIMDSLPDWSASLSCESSFCEADLSWYQQQYFDQRHRVIR